MVYRKKSYRKKRTTTAKKSLVKKVNWLVRKEKMEVNNLKHYWFGTTLLSSTFNFANPFVGLINGLAEGNAGVNDRNGVKCKWNTMSMNLNFFRTTTTAAETHAYRVLIVREKTTLGSNIALAQLFNSATPNVIDVFNVNNRDKRRFHVYYDKTFYLGPSVTTQGGIVNPTHFNTGPSPVKVLRIRKKLRFLTDYSRGNTGGVSDIDTNGLFLIIMTNNAVSNTSVEMAMTATFADQ